MIASPWLRTIGGYVGGEWVQAASGATWPVHDPATGEALAEVPEMGETDAEAAVQAAAETLHATPSLATRESWLTAIADRLEADADALGEIITREQGKPLREGEAEVRYAAGFYRYAAEHIAELAPRALPERARGCRWRVFSRPAGVVGLITPWNFPLAMHAKKFSAALAAGCPSISKPDEHTPLSLIAFWHLLAEMDLPPGMANLVTGQPAPIGRVLCTHPAVRALSFTGSTDVGRLLRQQAAPHIKTLTLELGGNAPFLVMDDAELEAAADALLANKFRAGGQTCVCANRILVHQSVASRFVELTAERMQTLRVGQGTDPAVDIGPLIHRAAWQKVRDHVQDALDHGAKRMLGETPQPPAHDWGAWFPPTLVTGVTPAMRLFQEETFGPVVAVATFESDEEALHLANATPYGLAAYLFTTDPGRAARAVDRLRFGHVGLNTATGPAPHAPFGGMKDSGLGREGGREGLREFIETQVVAEAPGPGS